VFAGIKAVQNRIVMRDDLLKAERARIGGHVPIGDEDDVITQANGPPHGGVDAVLSHASGNDETPNAAR